jgi:ribosomal protein S18 acetylase RimI-like enzyme
MEYRYLRPGGISLDHVADINRLLGQLTASPQPISFREVEEITKLSFLLVALNEHDRIIGMSTLSIFRIPMGKVGLLDDVVVEESYRGQGVGQELVGLLVNQAGIEGVERIELTCKPERTAASKLYEKLGFKQRATNNWTLQIMVQ